MWFGTSNGLVRYDGNNFISFNSGNSAIRGNRTTVLVRDNDGLVWVVYSNQFTADCTGKIDILNTTTNVITPFLAKVFLTLPLAKTMLFI